MFFHLCGNDCARQHNAELSIALKQLPPRARLATPSPVLTIGTPTKDGGGSPASNRPHCARGPVCACSRAGAGFAHTLRLVRVEYHASRTTSRTGPDRTFRVSSFFPGPLSGLAPWRGFVALSALWLNGGGAGGDVSPCAGGYVCPYIRSETHSARLRHGDFNVVLGPRTHTFLAAWKWQMFFVSAVSQDSAVLPRILGVEHVLCVCFLCPLGAGPFSPCPLGQEWSRHTCFGVAYGLGHWGPSDPDVKCFAFSERTHTFPAAGNKTANVFYSGQCFF